MSDHLALPAPLYYDIAGARAVLYGLPTWGFNSPKAALQTLTDLVSDAQELSSVLAQYPTVRYQPLDTHYGCLAGLAALDEALIADWAHHYGWRGAAGAAFLTMLAPNPVFRRHLVAARANLANHEWAARFTWCLDAALAELDAEGFTPWAPQLDAIAALRAVFEHLPRQARPLARVPAPEVASRKADAVRAAYREGGFEAARAVLARFPG